MSIRGEQSLSDGLLIPSEREFLRQRLTQVQQWLANPDREFIYDKGSLRYRTQPANRRDITHEREARLLRKLLARTRKGRALKTLKDWRRQLGTFLAQHRRRHEKVLGAHDDWQRLPRHQRRRTPEPPKPPSALYVDQQGARWIIDERFLALLDDLIERLQRWLDEE